MRNSLPEIITIIVVIIFIGIMMVAALMACEAHDDKLWNDGHCNNCGSALEYEQAVGHRSSTSYIYVCKKCGRRIEIYEVR